MQGSSSPAAGAMDVDTEQAAGVAKALAKEMEEEEVGQALAVCGGAAWLVGWLGSPGLA